MKQMRAIRVTHSSDPTNTEKKVYNGDMEAHLSNLVDSYLIFRQKYYGTKVKSEVVKQSQSNREIAVQPS